MHELSIAMSLLDVAAEEAAKLGAVRVISVRLKLGPLSGVVREALLSAFELAREDSLLPGCILIIEETPIIARCPLCNELRPVVSAQKMCCNVCETPVSDIISGRELEIVALEIIDEPADTIGRSPAEGPQAE